MGSQRQNEHTRRQSWQVAEYYLRGRQANGTKLKRAHKVNGQKEGIPYSLPDHAQPVFLVHSFIKIDDEIYELLEAKSHGGFGRVKLVKDKHDRSYLAKIQYFQGTATECNINQEAIIAFDCGLAKAKGHQRLDKRKHYNIQYIKGQSLELCLRKNPDLKQAVQLKLAIKVVLSVYQLHSGDLSREKIAYAHLDIKPHNITIDRQENIHLIDFGCSKRLDDFTPGLLAGTPDYIPLNYRELTSFVTNDLFALVRTLYLPSEFYSLDWNKKSKKGLVSTVERQQREPELHRSILTDDTLAFIAEKKLSKLHVILSKENSEGQLSSEFSAMDLAVSLILLELSLGEPGMPSDLQSLEASLWALSPGQKTALLALYHANLLKYEYLEPVINKPFLAAFILYCYNEKKLTKETLQSALIELSEAGSENDSILLFSPENGLKSQSAFALNMLCKTTVDCIENFPSPILKKEIARQGLYFGEESLRVLMQLGELIKANGQKYGLSRFFSENENSFKPAYLDFYRGVNELNKMDEKALSLFNTVNTGGEFKLKRLIEHSMLTYEQKKLRFLAAYTLDISILGDIPFLKKWEQAVDNCKKLGLMLSTEILERILRHKTLMTALAEIPRSGLNSRVFQQYANTLLMLERIGEAAFAQQAGTAKFLFYNLYSLESYAKQLQNKRVAKSKKIKQFTETVKAKSENYYSSLSEKSENSIKENISSSLRADYHENYQAVLEQQRHKVASIVGTVVISLTVIGAVLGMIQAWVFQAGYLWLGRPTRSAQKCQEVLTASERAFAFYPAALPSVEEMPAVGAGM